MSLWQKLFSTGPALRNKPGGLAMIRTHDRCGAEVLNGRIVTTVRADTDGFWTVDPEQTFVTTAPTRLFDTPGVVTPTGSVVTVALLSDSALVPLKDPGQGERDESAAWLPPVPSKAPRKVTS